MNELQRKDKKVVMSAKAPEAIYHMASSSVGKLISGKQYLGGYTMEQQRGKAEAEGKELPYKRRKKLQMKDTIDSYRRITKFAEKVNGKGIWTRKIEEKRLETDEFLEDLRSSWKTRQKMYCLVLKIEHGVWYSEKRKDSWDSRMT